ncbi:MAG: alpha/beta hydrolase, partial [Bacteroidota bacterium]
WIRANAANLSIDSNKIIGKGISAGGHLISSISVLQDEDDSDLPNALILFSPAIDTKDGYFVDLLHEGVDPISVSALDNLKSGLKMPRTLILQGETDSLTPTIHAQAFKEKMHTLGYDCQLKIYEDCGHLFTPSHLDDKGWPQSDPEKLRLSYIEQAKFYRELGYVR